MELTFMNELDRFECGDIQFKSGDVVEAKYVR